MKKSKKYGVVMLVVFMGTLAMPLFSTPAEALVDKDKAHVLFFENGDEHNSQWLIRSVSEGDESSHRSENSQEEVFLFNYCANYHSNIQNVRYHQTSERIEIRLPKARLYLLNSVLTI